MEEKLTNEKLRKAIHEQAEQTAMEHMKLNDENLQKLFYVIKHKIELVNNELTETDINNVKLDDIMQFKSNLKYTITLAEDIKICFELLTYLIELYYGFKKENRTIEEHIRYVEDINETIDGHDFKYLTEKYNDKKALSRPYSIDPYIELYMKHNE